MHCNSVVESDIFSNNSLTQMPCSGSLCICWKMNSADVICSGRHGSEWTTHEFLLPWIRAWLTSMFCTKFGDVLLKTVNQLTSICMTCERHLVATLFLPLQLDQIKSNWLTLTETIHFTYNLLITSVCLLWVSKYFHWRIKSASWTHWDFNPW